MKMSKQPAKLPESSDIILHQSGVHVGSCLAGVMKRDGLLVLDVCCDLRGRMGWLKKKGG